jgi:hypothetical protein
MLNNKCDVVELEIDKMAKEILDLIRIIDNCANEKQYVINYMVENNIGDFNFCEIMYNSYENKNEFIVPLDDIIELFGTSFKEKIINIKKNFIDYYEDYVYRLNEEQNEIQKTTNELFDSDTDEEFDSKKQNINLNFISKNNNIFLNYDGISNFFQYLSTNENYFKFLQDHHKIIKFNESCQYTMMKAIHELFALQEKMLSINKHDFFYGSYY